MFIIIVDTKQGPYYIGPFGADVWAELYARDNLKGFPYRLQAISDPVQARNHFYVELG